MACNRRVSSLTGRRREARTALPGRGPEEGAGESRGCPRSAPLLLSLPPRALGGSHSGWRGPCEQVSGAGRGGRGRPAAGELWVLHSQRAEGSPARRAGRSPRGRGSHGYRPANKRAGAPAGIPLPGGSRAAQPQRSAVPRSGAPGAALSDPAGEGRRRGRGRFAGSATPLLPGPGGGQAGLSPGHPPQQAEGGSPVCLLPWNWARALPPARCGTVSGDCSQGLPGWR